jgi:antitoxin component of MazEF toxin-antitoxin module
MKYQNKLVRNGNSTHVAIPRRLLDWLQWNCGQVVVVEANLDRSLTIRKPTVDDLNVGPAPGAHIGLLPSR